MIVFTSILLLLNWVKSNNADQLEPLSIEKIDEDTIGNEFEKVIEIGLRAGKNMRSNFYPLLNNLLIKTN